MNDDVRDSPRGGNSRLVGHDQARSGRCEQASESGVDLRLCDLRGVRHVDLVYLVRNHQFIAKAVLSHPCDRHQWRDLESLHLSASNPAICGCVIASYRREHGSGCEAVVGCGGGHDMDLKSGSRLCPGYFDATC